MPTLRLESAADGTFGFDLNQISTTGYGVEVLTGVTGLGLPPVTLQWFEGAGDGAVFRGRRVTSRDIDLPLYVYMPDRASMRALLAKATQMLEGAMKLWFVEDDGERWGLTCYRVGGGSYVYGSDTVGENELRTVITLRAGDPFFEREAPNVRKMSRATTGRGLIKNTDAAYPGTGLDSLIKMRLSSAQVAGQLVLENTGDAVAYPVWLIEGPASNIIATGPNGDIWQWNGSLLVGETLTIDSRTARAIDGTGTNRYSDFAPAPHFWTVPPGRSSANVVMSGSGTITVSWRPRKWAVI